MHPEDLRLSYDAVAEVYARQFADELARKPFDRALLDQLVPAFPSSSVLEIGCGPGHVGRYLSDRGLEVVGVDLSPAMIDVARRLNPGMRFEAADMRELPFADRSQGGVVAFYSLLHIPRDEVAAVLSELARVLLRSGRVLVAVHGGSGTISQQEFLGQRVPFEATLFEKDELVGPMEAAGFEVVSATMREPYEFESQTPRMYVSAIRV